MVSPLARPALIACHRHAPPHNILQCFWIPPRLCHIEFILFACFSINFSMSGMAPAVYLLLSNHLEVLMLLLFFLLVWHIRADRYIFHSIHSSRLLIFSYTFRLNIIRCLQKYKYFNLFFHQIIVISTYYHNKNIFISLHLFIGTISFAHLPWMAVLPTGNFIC